MCGRFALRTPQAVLIEHFPLKSIPQLVPRYNIAPTQQIGVVREAAPQQREFVSMQWGLVPRWAKDPKIGNQMINAGAPRRSHVSRCIQTSPLSNRGPRLLDWQKTVRRPRSRRGI